MPKTLIISEIGYSDPPLEYIQEVKILSYDSTTRRYMAAIISGRQVVELLSYRTIKSLGGPDGLSGPEIHCHETNGRTGIRSNWNNTDRDNLENLKEIDKNDDTRRLFHFSLDRLLQFLDHWKL